MVRATALDIQVSLRNPTAMLEDSMTSVNTLYTKPHTLSLSASFYCRRQNTNNKTILEYQNEEKWTKAMGLSEADPLAHKFKAVLLVIWWNKNSPTDKS